MEYKEGHIETSERDTYFYIKLKGMIYSSDSTKIHDYLEAITKTDKVQIALDMSEVQYAESRLLGTIFKFCDQIKSKNGKVVIVNPSDFAHNLLKVTMLVNYIDIRHNVEDIDSVFE
jgi:anti-anti-sigma factor